MRALAAPCVCCVWEERHQQNMLRPQLAMNLQQYQPILWSMTFPVDRTYKLNKEDVLDFPKETFQTLNLKRANLDQRALCLWTCRISTRRALARSTIGALPCSTRGKLRHPACVDCPRWSPGVVVGIYGGNYHTVSHDYNMEGMF